MVGDGVFETLRVYGGVPFAWRRHYERLALSANGLGLAVPPSRELRAAADAVLDANALQRCAAARHGHRRAGAAGVEPRRRDDRPRSWSRPPVNRAGRQRRRRDRPVEPQRARRVRRVEDDLVRRERARPRVRRSARGADEAIFPNTRDELCEATGSNVFVVRDGVLRTPPRDVGCLLGVTRALLSSSARTAASRSRKRRSRSTTCAAPTRRSCRRRCARCSPSRPSTAAPLPAAPGPVTRAPRRRVHELRRPRPRPVAARSRRARSARGGGTRRASGGAEVDDVGGGDGLERAVVAGDLEHAVGGEPGREPSNTRSASSTRTRRPSVAERAAHASRSARAPPGGRGRSRSAS